MTMNDMISLVMNYLKNNSNILNNPNAIEMFNVIQNGDSVKGKEIAQNICNTYGVTTEKAIENAKKYFRVG